METPFVFTLHEGLPRQGPGSSECTRKAFSFLSGLPARPEILDIGCGAGMQTIELARLCPGCRITAVDIHQPFLAQFISEAASAGVDGRINIVQASMEALPFPDKTFDLIWAEGSIFIIGFAEGLNFWRRLLRSGGYLCLTESVWFTENPSPEALSFWNECYPAIGPVTKNCAIAEDAGYRVVAAFPLPDSAWWDNYYAHVLRRIDDLLPEVAGNPGAMAQIEFARREIEIFRKHAGEYGYEFFILQKKD